MERDELNRMIADKRKQNELRAGNVGKKPKRNIDWALIWVIIAQVVIVAFWLFWVGVLIWGVIHLVNWITTK
jgi:hypothetical protein